MRILFLAALLCGSLISPADAQYGGRPRGDRQGTTGNREAPREGARAAAPAATVVDPMAAIERELPSLRIDLKLEAAQAALFDSFEREVRNASRAQRDRARQLAGFRLDDGSTVGAASLLATVQETDAVRADAMKRTLEKFEALAAACTPEQRKQLDRRIMLAVREPLGAS